MDSKSYTPAPFAKVRPSGVLVMRTGDRVFMVKRKASIKFMGGYFSFPGGKVDKADADITVLNPLPDVPSKFLVAVLREAFEETGWLCAPGAPEPGVLAADRQALLQGEISFAALLGKYNLNLDAGPLHYCGTWVTPPFQPYRFEARHFLLDIPTQVDLSVNEGEHSEGFWITPKEMLARYKTGKISLPPPTWMILDVLTKGLSDQEFCHTLVNRSEKPGTYGRRIYYRHGVQHLPLLSETLPPAAFTNLYMVGQKHVFLIDPATRFTDERQKIIDYLDELKKDGMTPHKILLTHQHPDHVSAANFLRDKLSVPVAASQITADLLQGICPVDEIINDGDVLSAGEPWSLKAIFTPGHAPGHLCFYEAFTSSLFAGDMVTGFGTVFINVDDGGDMQTYLASLEKIKTIDCDLLLPAHGGSIAESKKHIQELIDHRNWREQKVVDALAGVSDLDGLVQKVYDDVSENVMDYARLSAKSILHKLYKEGALPQDHPLGSIFSK